jgi:hypothetical protein
MQNEKIFSEDAFTTIFRGALVPQHNKGGGVHHYRAHGFRYEDPEVMREEEIRIVEETRIPPDGRGVYSAKVIIKGRARPSHVSGFFPESMARGDILRAISEAYENKELVEINQKLFRGKAGNLQIYMFLDEAGRVFDAYPKRYRYTKLRAALDKLESTGQRSNLLCPICLQPKIRICPTGHWPPRRQGFHRRMLNRLKRSWSGAKRMKGAIEK